MVSEIPNPTEVEPFEIGVSTVVAALAVLLVAYIVARVVAYALTGLSERSVKRRITVKMFVPLTKFLIYATALIYVLGPVFELSSTQILAFSGILGAVLGLGIKDLFANIVGGFVIVLERPYSIGDMVEFGDNYGEVTNIGLRSTELTTLDDSLVIVPNYLFFTKSVSNSNNGSPEMMVVPEFYVASDADLDRAVSIVSDALTTSRYVYMSDEHGVTVRVEDGRGYTKLRAKAYVNDVRNEPDFRTDVTERVLRKFDEEGIERPDVHAALLGDG